MSTIKIIEDAVKEITGQKNKLNVAVLLGVAVQIIEGIVDRYNKLEEENEKLREQLKAYDKATES